MPAAAKPLRVAFKRAARRPVVLAPFNWRLCLAVGVNAGLWAFIVAVVIPLLAGGPD
ncbi:MAG: hypothetical protein ACK4YQ_16865 [Phenylobacterium sp.]|uniref:hypothetical protein n=1 Tax=Phenylobacterium sp. TaxID=1871053 RepID=UPI003918CC39